ncbi:MAG: ABC transporter permease [Ignavibacteriaceae bacterium]|nr:ABC transporter permease [Ignavibacteriaceae bacterium]
MIKKIAAIAKWEFLEKLKTKAFLISLIITPIIIVSITILPSIIFSEEHPNVEVIGIIDTSGIYFDFIAEELQKYELPDGQKNYVPLNLTESGKSFNELINNADVKVFDNLIKGYLILSTNSNDSLTAEFRTNVIGSLRVAERLEEALNKFQMEQVLEKAGVNIALLNHIQNRTVVQQKKISEDGKISEQDFFSTFFLSVIFILLLMMMVVYSGQMMVRSLIEEKSSRLIEMLISSSTPDELLTGKILGLSMLGLTQMLIWILIGISLAASALIPAAAFRNLLPMLLYFILGYLFYASLFVGIGSSVNTEQEAQHITTYLSLILMLPVVIALPAIQNPDFYSQKFFHTSRLQFQQL